jgi:glycerol-3-phosphate acyltransferase PlsY
VPSLVASLLTAYLLGSFPTSILAGRLLRGIDIRQHGSGNAGAANALRVLGWWPGLTVLAIDLAKGWVAVRLAVRLCGDTGPLDPAWVGALAGGSAMAGHLWPAFARFRGGKGVATAAGAMLAIEPRFVAVAVPVFLLTVVGARRVSAASMLAACSVPIVFAALHRWGGVEVTPAAMGFAALSAVVVLVAHRSNIRNLLAGREPPIGGGGATRR